MYHPKLLRRNVLGSSVAHKGCNVGPIVGTTHTRPHLIPYMRYMQAIYTASNVVYRPKLLRLQLGCTKGVYRGTIPHMAAPHSVHEVRCYVYAKPWKLQGMSKGTNKLIRHSPYAQE